MTAYRKLRVIISGGGTGGHIFPAISIANRFKEVNPETEILFVGANGKMEMENVPAAGYKIVGLPICGLQRRLTLKNIWNDIQVPFKILISNARARKLIRTFKPDIAVGVGGYASAPLLFAATRLRVPSLIQEQNGFAGLTNKMLGDKVGCICVAYEGMEKFFPAEKIVLTGNPIRSSIKKATPEMRAEAIGHYELDGAKRQLLVIGGSLGCGTLNKTMKKWIEAGCPGGEDVEVIWQCGKYYEPDVRAFMEGRDLPNVHWSAFIDRMDLAYAAADLIVSRSGASSVSEICVAGKPCVFVPSPNVAEDHQTHNAMALVRKEAAEIVKDAEAAEKLMPLAMDLIHNAKRLDEIGANALKMALPDAAALIVDEAYKLV
ncbi:MAG: undecaprenyldiphospho-muramoylpentapeptide beta-N-acetylglucosaminyltransferase [Bacteroidales bacterium]|nr:undecaprenyldiphospho-muramoylpentapeptide beta-N-acetylglucosaminyltransferase [Bacteroidales bacterium]